MSLRQRSPEPTLAEIGNVDPRPSSAPRGDEAMARYANGDDSAFSELYDEVSPRLMAFLIRKTGDRALAEDLAQQTLLQMHRARGSFTPGSPVMPWTFAIARRLVIDEFRRTRRRGPPAADELPDVADPIADCGYQNVSAGQIAHRLDDELQRLPASQRRAFELMRLDGLTLVEAAVASGTTVSALKSRSHRAYESLRVAFIAVLGGPHG